MKTIYKYVISNIPDVVSGANLSANLSLPVGAKILCCKIQKHVDVCVWVELDTEVEQKENVFIAIYGTGFNMKQLEGREYKYIDTFMVGEGVYVYHVYAIKN